MKTLIILLLAVACARMELTVNGEKRTDIQLVRHEKYTEIKGAENVLRKTSGATLMIRFRQKKGQKTPQDLISLSVGGSEQSSLKSRAAIRIESDGRLKGLARAGDLERVPQEITADIPVTPEITHLAALTVDYAKDVMKLYLDGKEVKSSGITAFSQKETSDTASLSCAIGSEDDGSTFFFEGDLSDPAVWNRSLTAEEIEKLSQ